MPKVSNVEGGQKTPWTLSKVPSAPIWYSPVREKRKKRKMKGNQIWEKISAHTENSPCTYWFSKKRALCAMCKKADPAETNLSRANRVKQDNQFHNADKGDIIRSGNSCTELVFCDQGRCWPRRTRKLLAWVTKSKCILVQNPAVNLWEVGGQLPIEIDTFSQIHWRFCKEIKKKVIRGERCKHFFEVLQ